jgi:lysozyme family protein
MFKEAVEHVLKNEGGYVDDPLDNGGATNFGISIRFLKRVQSNVTIDTIKNLTVDDAKLLYKTYFWNNNNYERIADKNLVIKLFDISVNVGSSRAKRLLQESVRAVNNIELVQDGVLGPKSLYCINNVNAEALLSAFKMNCASYYKSLNQPRFLTGWLNRVFSV